MHQPILPHIISPAKIASLLTPKKIYPEKQFYRNQPFRLLRNLLSLPIQIHRSESRVWSSSAPCHLPRARKQCALHPSDNRGPCATAPRWARRVCKPILQINVKTKPLHCMIYAKNACKIHPLIPFLLSLIRLFRSCSLSCFLAFHGGDHHQRAKHALSYRRRSAPHPRYPGLPSIFRSTTAESTSPTPLPNAQQQEATAAGGRGRAGLLAATRRRRDARWRSSAVARRIAGAARRCPRPGSSRARTAAHDRPGRRQRRPRPPPQPRRPARRRLPQHLPRLVLLRTNRCNRPPRQPRAHRRRLLCRTRRVALVRGGTAPLVRLRR
jgi:hypothetical protein